MNRCATLLLVAVLILSSLIIVGSAFAQSIPKPSVPEFTVKYIDSSYYVPQFMGLTNTQVELCRQAVAFGIIIKL